MFMEDVSKGRNLGEAEHLALLAAKRLDGPSSSADVRDTIEDRTGRVLTVSAIYVTLMCLEKKGFLTSELGEPTQVRGGKARRGFFVTDSGNRALEEVRRQWQRLWEGMPASSDGVTL